MAVYVFRRLLAAVPTLFGITLLTFFLAVAIPGDPALVVIGPQASQETLGQVRHELGLDRPLPSRYLHYLKELSRGDLGQSLLTRQPVAEELGERLPATLELTLAAMALAIVGGVVLGVIAATRGGLWDSLARVVAVAGISIPVFCWGLLLILVFYRELAWLPAQGRFNPYIDVPQPVTGLYLLDSVLNGSRDSFLISLRHLVLPALALGYAQLAIISRMTRASLLDVMNEDYIRTARAKGLPKRTINYKHALKSAAAPVLTVVGLTFGDLLGGAVLIETIFDWPGMGQYAVEATVNLDYPAILGFTLVVGVGFTLVNLMVDLLYVLFDPRIRYG